MPKLLIAVLALSIAATSYTEAAETKRHSSGVQRAVYKTKHKKTKSARRAPTTVLSGTTESLLYDITNRRIVHGAIDTEPMSIASISKLMTVYTVLRDQQDPLEVLTVPRISLNHTYLRAGMSLTRSDLVQLALVSSDNVAAYVLAVNGKGGYDAFITRMNTNAQQLGMMNTGFVEPTGLSARNQSTVQDLIVLTQSVQNIPEFRHAARSDSVTVPALYKNKTIRVHGSATNKMFGKDGVQVIKTGFTNAAGFCIAMIVEKNNNLYNIVILNSRSKVERERIIKNYLSQVI